MTFQNCFSVLIAATFPVLAFAQDDQPARLKEHLQVVSHNSSFQSSRFVDLDRDGSQELIVIFEIQDLEGAGDTVSKEWRVLDEKDDNVVMTGRWYGENIDIIDTQPVGSNLRPRWVISSDGSFWTLYKGKMRPFGDLISERQTATYKGSSEDVRYFADFNVGPIDPNHIMKTRIDFMDERGFETVMSLAGGDAYWREEDGATPYVIVTESGEVIHSGWSFLAPAIYPWKSDGFQIIERVNFSYEGIYFE